MKFVTCVASKSLRCLSISLSSTQRHLSVQRYSHIIDALNPQNLEISPEFPDFPEFELRSPERSQKSGISRFLHGKSPEWTGIALKWAKNTFFISICVEFAREAGLSNGASICWKAWQLNSGLRNLPKLQCTYTWLNMTFCFTRVAFYRPFHFSRMGCSWIP